MTISPNFTAALLILTVLVLLPQVHAFGAGDIPDFAFLNDKAFRHGDIENILATLAKTAGHVAASGGGGDLLGFATSLIKSVASGPGGAKFSSGDIKKVYFGNWLRDYSQAMDIAGLSKLTADSLVLVVSVLGFMTFGFATEEFEVTAERLGVYLPTEHIDNPKGYAAKEGDARSFHPKLRPPVDERELQIDERTGMKKYMATENQGWDTSTALIRRVFTKCIEMGRRAQGRDGPELYEAYRLLGTGLHTLEDLLAHSNWIEIALRKMGHSEVFCHVGEDTDINTPNGRAPPLVTGTFGGADFIHSLLGETTDKLSQASVTDLSSKMSQAQSGDNDAASKISALKSILGKLPIGGGDSKVQEGEELQAASKAYNFDPDNIAPPEVQQKLVQLLKWHDGLMRDILKKIEMIPGLDELVDELSNALNAYVYTVIAPWVTPILQQATSVLGEGSKAVIDSEEQYEVFDNPRASDPSHSLLSKDHFGLILNEPAGKIALLVVEHSVKLIVQAWSDNNDPNQAIDLILEAFHHPYYANNQSRIQSAMFQEAERWLRDLGDDVARQTINALTKESVREGKNKRLGSENESLDEPGYGACGHGAQPNRRPQGSNQSYGSSGGGGQHRQQQQTQSSYSSGNNNQYGSDNNRQSEARTGGYGQSDEYSSGRREETHSSRRNDNEDSHGSRRNESSGYAPSYGQSQESSYQKTEEPSYGSGRGGSTGYGRTEEQSYGSSGGGGYGSSANESGRGASGYGRSEETGYGRTEQSSYGQESGRGSSGYGKSEQSSYVQESGRGSSGYGRSEETSYGQESGRGTSGYGKSEQSSYGQESGRGASAYGRSEEPSYGQESGRGSSGYGSSEQSSYGQESGRGASGYGRSEEQSYGGGNEYGSSGRGASGYGNQESNYSSQRRGGDETFGAERLNLDDDNERRGGDHHGGHHKKDKHHKSRSDDSD